ncbi:MAG TPA: glucosyl-3-phosphoglycerate synthase [Streptosporangiaceae bacterium]|nr:glucosyl-3-phosphoglycerate synthase [Streptosporangiaceae bacterium]
MRTHDWFRSHSFHYSDFGNASELGEIKRDRGVTVSLILPTRNVAETIASVLDEVNDLRHPDIGLIDQVIVVDADSTDGTAEIAHGYDAEVYSENALMPEYGPVHGKGDAMWRGLSVATGDIIAFADTDTGNFCKQLVTGVVGCLVARPELRFVKAAYRRPYTQESLSVPDGGGRVTELACKPALNLLFPELAGFVQPLAGEFGGARDVLYSIPFFSGYAVEVGMLIDVLDACGLSAMAQVDAGMRKNRHQDLGNLSRMGYAVLRAVLTRATQRRLLGAELPVNGWTESEAASYLHAVAAAQGVQLEEYAEIMIERPPMLTALLDRPRLASASAAGS